MSRPRDAQLTTTSRSQTMKSRNQRFGDSRFTLAEIPGSPCLSMCLCLGASFTPALCRCSSMLVDGCRWLSMLLSMCLYSGATFLIAFALLKWFLVTDIEKCESGGRGWIFEEKKTMAGPVQIWNFGILRFFEIWYFRDILCKCIFVTSPTLLRCSVIVFKL